MDPNTTLARLAHRAGILPEYHQIDGTHRPCGPETAEALLSAMGLSAGSEAEAAETLARIAAADSARRLPPVLLTTAGEAARHRLPPWRLTLEEGGALSADPFDTARLPPLPMGVHRLETADGRETAWLIASPRRAPCLPELIGADRAWGVFAALYGLRSGRNGGLGDYEDLARTAEALGGTGAAFLGINPVHARGTADDGISPYSPSSRTTLDTSHIALDRVPGGDAPEVRRLLAAAEPRLAAARAAELVEHAPIRAVADPVLRAAFAAFPDTAEAAEFERWAAAEPEEAHLQAGFEALSLTHGPDWRAWAPALRDPAGAEARTALAERAGEQRYHLWLQWLAERQLAEAQHRARAAGLSLGLYLDAAVGVRPGAAETWAGGAVFATGVSLGAPPDRLGPAGQAWNLAPFSPLALEATGYGAFRAMLRSTMAHAGIVRIDHVIGFARSFWVPDDGTPGGYVAFPLSVLLALTRIEAHRAGCFVVGEDLGTVPDGLREALAGSGLFGCAILPFEWEGHAIRHPAGYRAETLATFGTHDLPSVAGWWLGRDIAERLRLGQFDAAQAEQERAGRAGDRRQLCHRLAEIGLLPQGIDPHNPPEAVPEGLADALHAFLAESRAGLVSLSLDDIFGVEEQQNLPGTVRDVPNWRRRAPVSVEALAHAPELARAAAVMQARRPRQPPEGAP